VSNIMPEPGRHGWADLLRLTTAVRGLAFDRTLPPSEALGLALAVGLSAAAFVGPPAQPRRFGGHRMCARVNRDPRLRVYLLTAVMRGRRSVEGRDRTCGVGEGVRRW
jgi:hypothetical protein